MAGSGFDRVARIYRWGEQLTFGPLLMRCRTAFLDTLSGMQHVLVLGDGDGRFTATALARYPKLHVTAVDSSPAMLQLLSKACREKQVEDRLTTVLADARSFVPESTVDAICAHFFLDCLSTADTERLARNLAPFSSRWIISDFDIPKGVWRVPASLLVRSLYLAFRVMTGLSTQQLPDWRKALFSAGFCPNETRRFLKGILVAESWRHSEGPSAASEESDSRT